MNAQVDQALIEKLKALPPERRAEVEDFVDFLRTARPSSTSHAAPPGPPSPPSRPSGITRKMPSTTGCDAVRLAPR
jgi:hypothetical protein